MQVKVSIIVVRYRASWCQTVTLETEISVCTSQLWKILIVQYILGPRFHQSTWDMQENESGMRFENSITRRTSWCQTVTYHHDGIFSPQVTTIKEPYNLSLTHLGICKWFKVYLETLKTQRLTSTVSFTGWLDVVSYSIFYIVTW